MFLRVSVVLDSKLNKVGKTFPITRIAKPYGEPADHRITIVNDEIVVVYQTLNFRKGTRPKGGPSEDFATDQSLLLARFTLDGKELFRGAIVDRATDFRKDNFPDHCLLWSQGRLLVSSGTRARVLHIREVGLDATELLDHIFPIRRDGISSSIGNSMHQRGSRVGFFSSNSPTGNGALVLTVIDTDFKLARITEFGGNDGVERHFPTDSMMLGDYTLVSYIARSVGSKGTDLNTNPYHPRLMVIDASYKVVEDIPLGKGGFAHVHPTMTILEDQLFVGWSKRSQHKSPQVRIERFSITWKAAGSDATGN